MHTEAGAAVIYLAGDLDIARADEVARAIDAAITDSHALVTLDLSAVTFMDCAGLHPILEARNRLGDRLWLRRPARPVSRLLALTQLTATFHMSP